MGESGEEGNCPCPDPITRAGCWVGREERDYGDRIGELGRGLLRGAKEDFFCSSPLWGKDSEAIFCFPVCISRGLYLFLLVFFYLADSLAAK